MHLQIFLPGKAVFADASSVPYCVAHEGLRRYLEFSKIPKYFLTLGRFLANHIAHIKALSQKLDLSIFENTNPAGLIQAGVRHLTSVVKRWWVSFSFLFEGNPGIVHFGVLRDVDGTLQGQARVHCPILQPGVVYRSWLTDFCAILHPH